MDISKSTISPFLDKLQLDVEVLVGSAVLTVHELSQLGAGAIITLDRNADDPVEIHVNGKCIAQGELMLLDDGRSRLAVTVTSATSDHSNGP